MHIEYRFQGAKIKVLLQIMCKVQGTVQKSKAMNGAKGENRLKSQIHKLRVYKS